MKRDVGMDHRAAEGLASMAGVCVEVRPWCGKCKRVMVSYGENDRVVYRRCPGCGRKTTFLRYTSEEVEQIILRPPVLEGREA